MGCSQVLSYPIACCCIRNLVFVKLNCQLSKPRNCTGFDQVWARQAIEAVNDAVDQATMLAELGPELAQRGGLELHRPPRLHLGVRAQGFDGFARVLQPTPEQLAE